MWPMFKNKKGYIPICTQTQKPYQFLTWAGGSMWIWRPLFCCLIEFSKALFHKAQPTVLTMWWELIVKLTHPHSENWISQRSKLDFCAPPHLWGHATTQLSLSMTSVLFIIHLLPALFLPSIPHATSTLRSLSFGPRVLAAKGHL